MLSAFIRLPFCATFGIPNSVPPDGAPVIISHAWSWIGYAALATC